MSPLDNFLTAIAAAGMEPPAEIHPDGRLHRFSPAGKRGDDAGWYVLHLDGVPAGAFGNWREGLSQCWSAKDERRMTPAERSALGRRLEAARRLRDAELRQRQAKAAEAAAVRWAAATPAQDHPYLAAKGVRTHGVRVESGALLVPMRDTAGKLHNLQTIGPNGDKRFLYGGRVTGCYHAIGRPSGRLIVCEGLATGSTLHEATGDAVAVAFSAGNLLSVAVALRSKYPCLTIIIAADDDWKTTDPKTGEMTNPGMAAAMRAAQAVGGKVAAPDFSGLPRGDKDVDFNDLQRLDGAVVIGGDV